MRGAIASTAAQDEGSLVVAARGDPTAFGELYDRHVDPVYRFCLRRLGTVEDAEDATAQVFTKALAAFPGFRGGSFQGWLFAIAANVVVDAGRSERMHASLADADDVIDPEPGPEDSALSSDAARTVRELLTQLPPDQRRVLEMRLAGLTGVEIAQALGRSHGTIRNLQHRTLVRLRDLLGVTGAPEEEGGSHAR